jgi:hypothetical protein
MSKKYIIELSVEERELLRQIAFTGKQASRKRQHAQILLKADQADGAPAWTDARIAEAFEVRTRTVERIRQRCVEHGLEDALVRRQSPTGPQKHKRLDGAGEAQLCKLACSPAPDGREHWTLELLADRLVQLRVAQTIGRETVRTTLKKTNSSPG